MRRWRGPRNGRWHAGDPTYGEATEKARGTRAWIAVSLRIVVIGNGTTMWILVVVCCAVLCCILPFWCCVFALVCCCPQTGTLKGIN